MRAWKNAQLLEATDARSQSGGDAAPEAASSLDALANEDGRGTWVAAAGEAMARRANEERAERRQDKGSPDEAWLATRWEATRLGVSPSRLGADGQRGTSGGDWDTYWAPDGDGEEPSDPASSEASSRVMHRRTDEARLAGGRPLFLALETRARPSGVREVRWDGTWLSPPERLTRLGVSGAGKLDG